MLLITEPFAAPLVDVPSRQLNLFDRLIRDPTAPGRPARERLCTEMLCCTLLNAPALRNRVLQFLAKLVDTPFENLEDLDWHIGTERAIGNKRDDLRIEGCKRHGNVRVVLWTVEVKVQAALHESGALDLECDDEQVPETISQLLNYDRWLDRQHADHRTGFLLVVRPRDFRLPSGLTQAWKIVSWTRLGWVVEDAISSGNLPPADLLLARHLAGFIRLHLWEDLEMSDYTLSFDDIALIRAFASIGRQCAEKAKVLAAELQPLLDIAHLGAGKSGVEERMFGRHARAYAWKYLSKDEAVWIGAGLNAGTVAVWIESPPRHAQKDAIRAFLFAATEGLKTRNPRWEVRPISDGGWWDVYIEHPLERLLASEDQRDTLLRLVREAVDDLASVGAFDEIKKLTR